jgi:cytochrome c oxidase subunit 2
MMNRTLLIALVGAMLLVAACSQSQTQPTIPPQTQPASQIVEQVQPPQPTPPPASGQVASNGTGGTGQAGQGGTQTQSGVKAFTVVAKRFAFEPSTITVRQGDTVKITASSADVAHGFALPDFNVNLRLEPGARPQTVTFVADKKGTFTFYCNIPCGPGHLDMKGTLIVE